MLLPFPFMILRVKEWGIWIKLNLLISSQLIEYNDTKDKADLEMADEMTFTPLTDITWQDSNTTLNYTTCTGEFNMSNTERDVELGPNATLVFKVCKGSQLDAFCHRP